MMTIENVPAPGDTAVPSPEAKAKEEALAKRRAAYAAKRAQLDAAEAAEAAEAGGEQPSRLDTWRASLAKLHAAHIAPMIQRASHAPRWLKVVAGVLVGVGLLLWAPRMASAAYSYVVPGHAAGPALARADLWIGCRGSGTIHPRGVSGGTEATVSVGYDAYYVIDLTRVSDHRVSSIDVVVSLHTDTISTPTHSRGLGAWVWSLVSSNGAQESTLAAIRAAEEHAIAMSLDPGLEARVLETVKRNYRGRFGADPVLPPRLGSAVVRQWQPDEKK